MPRKFTHKKLVIASHNTGKIREIAELLADLDIEILSTADFPDLQEPVEDGDTFIANAEIKSRYVAKHTGLPALADDSGLSVDDLNDQPGIYSARWGGDGKDFQMAMERVGRELAELTEDDSLTSPSQNTANYLPKAHFTCALSLTWEDGHTESFEGKSHGGLTFPPRGDNGFGYDAIFIPTGYKQTFAEIPADDKKKLSHRSDAFNQLVDGCF